MVFDYRFMVVDEMFEVCKVMVELRELLKCNKVVDVSLCSLLWVLMLCVQNYGFEFFDGVVFVVGLFL